MRDAAGELDDLEAAGDRALGVGQRLAVLGGDHRRELVDVALDQLLEAEHHARALQRRGGGPADLGGLRRLNGGGDFGLRGEGDLCRQLARGGVEDIAEAALAVDARAVDEMMQCDGHFELTLDLCRACQSEETC